LPIATMLNSPAEVIPAMFAARSIGPSLARAARRDSCA
jgi:hypothetical protein